MMDGSLDTRLKVKLHKIKKEQRKFSWRIVLDLDEEFIITDCRNKNEVSKYCRDNNLNATEIVEK